MPSSVLHASSRRLARLGRTLAVGGVVLASIAAVASMARSEHSSIDARRVVASPLVTPTPLPTGRFVAAAGSDDVAGDAAPRAFVVEVEEGLDVAPAAFADEVVRVLSDPRSWDRALRRVESGGSFRVVLATPETTDRLCRPLDTGGIFSCYMRGRAVLNHARWTEGSQYYGSDLASYRAYMINHEVGHALGRGHAHCPGPGRPAPVMAQQTKGLDGCTPNPWPTP